ncbi:hypothetical protein [Pantoea phage Nafs113]|nr:hypothetical protein [Pantoea phage Nafs113]
MSREQNQALIEYCKEEARLKREHIARLEKHMPGQFNLTKYQTELQVAEIALAALTAPQPVKLPASTQKPLFKAEMSCGHLLWIGPMPDADFDEVPDGIIELYEHPAPVVTGENLDLLAAHREIADLKDQLAKSEAKFQNMLEAEHRLSDAYIRIREIVGTINLPEGADVWQATEAAAAKLVAMTGQPVKLPEPKHCPAEHHGSLLWHESEARNKAISECAAAIRAAGHEVQE